MQFDMRKALVSVAFFGCLLSTSDAAAQFANRSVGISPGFFGLFGPATANVCPVCAEINWMIPLTLDGSFYAESGFDIYAHAPVAVTSIKSRDSAGNFNENYITFGWGLQIGARYLFSEETVRPWVGLQLSALFVVRDPNPVMFYAGPGASVGLDLFVTDTFSIGPRAFFDFFLTFYDGRVYTRFMSGGAVSFSVYF
jgi:outer membrane protein